MYIHWQMNYVAEKQKQVNFSLYFIPPPPTCSSAPKTLNINHYDDYNVCTHFVLP